MFISNIGFWTQRGGENPNAFIFKVIGDSYTIPTVSSGVYNFDIDWGDGSADPGIVAWNDSRLTHIFPSSGEYTITITGDFDGWRINNSGDKLKIREIVQWGSLKVGVGDHAFWGAQNLIVTATDILDVSQCTTVSRFFRDTGVTTIPSINQWDLSNVITFNEMFRQTNSFNQDLSGIDTSSGENFSYMFRDASIFNQNIGMWDIGNMQSAIEMFRSSNLSTVNYDALLIGWAGQAHKSNVSFNAGNAKYTAGGAAQAARNALIADGWTIVDGGMV